MPRIESAKKAMRQARTRTVRNRAQRSALRTALKRVRDAVGPAATAAFANAVRLWGSQNPKFFEGTVVAKQAAAVLAQSANRAAAE